MNTIRVGSYTVYYFVHSSLNCYDNFVKQKLGNFEFISLLLILV